MAGRVRTFVSYVEGGSPLLKLHPSVKVLALISLNLTAWVIEAIVPLLALLACLLLLYPLLRAPLRSLSRALPYMLLVAQAVTLSYLLGSRVPGSRVYLALPWGAFVTERTLMLMASVVLRIACMVLASTLVFLSLRDVDVVYGFRGLGIPFAAAFTVNLSMRFATLFIEDYARIRDAMLLKGARLDSGGILERARLISMMGIPLMVLALRRMHDLSYVLEARGFPPRGRRTYIYEFRWSPADRAAAAALLALPALSAALRALGVFSFPGWPFL